MSAPESVTITLPASPCHAAPIGWAAVIENLRETRFVVLSDLADQIEAQLPKPKPEEPKGLGAVVKDRDGDRWVRVDPDTSDDADGAWESEYSFARKTYSAIDVVGILSEGVTA